MNSMDLMVIIGLTLFIKSIITNSLGDCIISLLCIFCAWYTYFEENKEED